MFSRILLVLRGPMANYFSNRSMPFLLLLTTPCIFLSFLNYSGVAVLCRSQVHRCLGITFHHHLLRSDVREHDPRHDGRQDGKAAEGSVRTSGREAVRRARRRPQHAKAVRVV